MENFDFWAKEWPVVLQATHILIPGAIVFLAGWVTHRKLSAQQIETLRERLAFAQERAAAAKDDAVALTKRIESDAPKKDLLESANSTVAAIDKLYYVTTIGDPTFSWRSRQDIIERNPLPELAMLQARDKEGTLSKKTRQHSDWNVAQNLWPSLRVRFLRSR
jgi:hypothetical protein